MDDGTTQETSSLEAHAAAVAAAQAELDRARQVLAQIEGPLQQALEDLEQAKEAQLEAADAAADGDAKAMKRVDEASRLLMNGTAMVEARRRRRDQAEQAVMIAEEKLRAAQELEREARVAVAADQVLLVGEEIHALIDGIADRVPALVERVRDFNDQLGRGRLSGAAGLETNVAQSLLEAILHRLPKLAGVKPIYQPQFYGGSRTTRNVGTSALACYGYYRDLPAGGHVDLRVVPSQQETAGPGGPVALELVGFNGEEE